MDAYQTYLKTFEDHIEEHVQAIITWMQAEFKKIHVDGVILGMSGGLDCSVVAGLCKLAEIPVQLVTMPRGNSMQYGQMNDARLLAETFDLDMIEVPVQACCDILETTCTQIKDTKLQHKCKGDVTMANANLGPIVRMSILSTLGQYMNYVMIGTGNLTERMMGYFTKRGDGLSDFNPLGELTKSEVRIIAKHIGVPTRIIEKAPSADLWEGQSDEEEMGIKIEDIDRYLLTGTIEDTIKEKIEHKIKVSEHKRKPIPMFPRKQLKIV